jgi:dTDP-glucose pyrophosphorylase
MGVCVHARAGRNRRRRPRRRAIIFDYLLAASRVLAERARQRCRCPDVGDLHRVAVRGHRRRRGRANHSFVEKPDDPPSTLAATATYIYHREHVPLVARYLGEGNAPDQVGSFIAWLHAREPVYAYRFAGRWLDIGDKEQLLAADNQLRRQQGLPERVEYQLEI